MPTTSGPNHRRNRRGVLIVENAERRPHVHRDRIAHAELLDAMKSSMEGGRGIVEIYRHEVLPARTRNIPLLGHKCTARIIHTLLGFEVQAAFKRIQCPDHVTARYLKLFTELGCRRIRLPYDPTITSRLIPELESAQKALEELVAERFPQSRPLRVYVLRRLYHHLRSRLRAE